MKIEILKSRADFVVPTKILAGVKTPILLGEGKDFYEIYSLGATGKLHLDLDTGAQTRSKREISVTICVIHLSSITLSSLIGSQRSNTSHSIKQISKLRSSNDLPAQISYLTHKPWRLTRAD